MLGAPGVGKTSLVQRFVESRFDERYIKTLGVKIDRKHVATPHGAASLIVWDIYGDEEELPSNRRHLRGMAGSLLVVDGTRSTTATIADQIREMNTGDGLTGPYVLMVNKSDLSGGTSLDVVAENCPGLVENAEAAFVTSALDGSNVEEAFTSLASALLS
jgi:small GTP-binding protein